MNLDKFVGVDFGKPVLTRCGYPVRIYAKDGGGSFPLHGACLSNGVWKVATWTAKGKNISDEHSLSPYDLVNVPEQIVVEGWVNIYPTGKPAWNTSGGSALCSADDNLLATIHVRISGNKSDGWKSEILQSE
jgi:hypothetical protein